MSYDSMDAMELRSELDAAYRLVCMEAHGYRQAVESGDVDWELRMGAALDVALSQARRIDNLLRAGIAA